jgi:adenine phosphoribosyltransferase
LAKSIAGGGSGRAARAGGKVAGLAFVIELEFLNGREKLSNYEFMSLLKY